MKVALNKCYGAFSLSDKAIDRFAFLKNYIVHSKEHRVIPGMSKTYIDANEFNFFEDKNRTDKDLISVIESLREDSSDNFSKIEIEEIPDECSFYIEDEDGYETVVVK